MNTKLSVCPNIRPSGGTTQSMAVWKQTRLYIAMLLLAFSAVLKLHAGLSYSGQAGLPEGYGMNGSAYGNNVYVVVGYNGYILRSTDGQSWAVVKDSSFINTAYSSVAFAQGLFVATSQNGNVITSADGLNWATQSSGTTNSLNYIAYLNGKFFAIGSRGVVLSSANATNWSAQNLGGSNIFEKITYGAGKFLMSSYSDSSFGGDNGGYLFTSTTGTSSWGSSRLDPTDGAVINFIGYLNNKFYAFMIDATNYTSTDGSTWTPIKSAPITYPNQVFGGIYANGSYYFYGSDTNGTYGAIYTSTDGTNFTENLPKTFTDVAVSLNYANGVFIETGNSGWATSTDASHWRYPAGNYQSVAYNGTNYVAVGYNGGDGYIITSPDWVNWTNTTPPSGRVQSLEGVVASKGKFVAVGYSGEGLPYAPILTSSDGYNWTATNSSVASGAALPDDFLSLAADGNGTIVAVGDQGHVIRSTDNGVTWSAITPAPAAAANGLDGVVYANSQFVAVGYGGAVIYSSDGSAWSDASYTADTGAELNSVTYGAGGYVIFGLDSNYNIFISKRTSLTSGSWTAPTTPPPSVPNNGYGLFVTYANGSYLGFYQDTNNEGYLLTSTNGSTWVQNDLNSTPYIYGATYAGGAFRLVGDYDYKGTATVGGLPPGITSVRSASGTNGSAFAYTITASNSPTSFGASGLPAGLSVNINSGAISGTPTVYGNYSVTVSATNAAGFGTAILALTIVNSNTPPVFVGSTTTLLVGENAAATDITGLLHVSDPDSGQTETWTKNSLPSHGTLTISGATASSGSANIAPGGTITYTPAANYFGPDSFAVQVSDGAGGTATRTITVTVNPPPGITSPLIVNGTNGSVFTYTITASNSPISFGATGLPAGLSVNTVNGLISGVPLTVGNFAVTISATNATGFGTAALTLTIVNSNTPPVFVGSTTTLLVGENAGATDITGLLHVSDPDSGQTETWAQNSAPSHGTLTISGATASSGSANIAPGGTITYTPATNYFGADSFAIQVSDGAGGMATRTITVTVNPTPGITSPLTASGTNASTFTYTITASNSPISFGATGLPPGLTVNTGSGVISGTPTTSGTFPVTISATNITGFGTAILTLTLANTNIPPVFVGSNTTLLVGENTGATDITALLHVSDPDSGQTETWTQSSAPSNGMLTFSNAVAPAGSADIAPGGLITYTPNTNYSGTDSFAVQVSDGAGGSATRTITVTVNPPTGITSGTSGSGIYGSPFTYTITASNNPTSFGAAGLPPGLSVNLTNGVITGTPTQAGSFPISIGATNSTSTGTAQLTLNIAQVNLTVSGVVANDKIYNGNTVATLNFSGATLNGVVNGDSITLNTNGVTATFASANVGNEKPVTISGLTISGVAVANYTFTPPTLVANILPVRAEVTLHRSVQLYDGTTKSITATTLPVGLPVNLTYNGSPAPSAVGAYTVIGTVANPNYSGGATNNLYIVTPPQFASELQNGTNATFTWSTMPQVNYQVIYTPSLAPLTWTNFGGPIFATNVTMSITDIISPPPAARFYRVKVILE